MAKNKQTDIRSNENDALEAKVDAMMDVYAKPLQPGDSVAPEAGEESTQKDAPLDIFAGTGSPITEAVEASSAAETPGAPALPGKTPKPVKISPDPAVEEPSPAVSPLNPELPIAELEALAGPSSTEDSAQVGDLEIKPLNIDTAQTDAAIDDIVAQEADEVLAAQDAGIQVANDEAEPAQQPVKHGHPLFWFVVLLLVIVAGLFAYTLTHPDLTLPFGA